jgi:hypothetical protein
VVYRLRVEREARELYRMREGGGSVQNVAKGGVNQGRGVAQNVGKKGRANERAEMRGRRKI